LRIRLFPFIAVFAFLALLDGCRGAGLLPSIPPTAPTATLVAAPATITKGNHATLTWRTTNSTTMSIDQGIGVVAAAGSTSVSPTTTTQYTLTATGPGGTVTATATVTVQAAAPTATLTASPTTITAGNKSVLTWNTTNATTVSINQGIGIVSPSGSTTVSPTQTTQYILTATGSSTVTAATTITVPVPGGVNSPITHLIIILMQNRTLDNLFGTYPGANGLDATLPSYRQVDAAGNIISPTPIQTLGTADLNHNRPSYLATWNNGAMNKFAFVNGDLSMQYYDTSLSGLASDGKPYGISTIWSYAQQYALADNAYSSAMNSEPAQELYMVAATVHDETTASALPFYDACSPEVAKQQGGDIAGPLTETTIGDQMTDKQVPWVFYQENFVNQQNGTCKDYVPQENVFQYFTSTANTDHIQNVTLSSFQSILAAGTLPSVLWLQPDGAHDMHPGSPNILDGVEWLDEVVQAVKGSSEWPNTAIVVLFDEGGGWYDHVPPPQFANSEGLGDRVPIILISPYAKTNYISHQQIDFVSIMRFIQWNWNLGQIPNAAQAAREQQSGDLCDLLTTKCGAPPVP
jgi:phospholipase C